MKKSRIIILAVSVCMLAILAIGGTLAYFTDSDSKQNTFTMGNVKIALVEQQRNADATALEKFTQNKTLLPVVGNVNSNDAGLTASVDGVSGLPTAKNFVDKIVTVKNTGKSEAYVRVFWAQPKVTSASVHVYPGESDKWSGVMNAGDATIDGIECAVYVRTYSSPLAAGEVTKEPAYLGLYLDKNVNTNDSGSYVLNGSTIDYDFSKGVTIHVFAQAVQTAGFNSSSAAFSEAGLKNPWSK